MADHSREDPGRSAGSDDPAARRAWRARRDRLVGRHGRSTPWGFRRFSMWRIIGPLLGPLGRALRLGGLYERGVRNALDIQLTELSLSFAELPPAFDGFRIVHLSDLHVDCLPGTTDRAIELLADIDADLCVLTGDYRRALFGPLDPVLPSMERLVAAVSARHGILAILGNHDSADMAEAFAGLGIRMLINETVTLSRGADALHVTGTDDIHRYYMPEAETALASAPDGFKIALVHTAEFAHVAAGHGFGLYLTGHTHGGQFCLPGGRPILTNLLRHRSYAVGAWQHGDMLGYTTTGTGVSGLPLRFNCRGEVAVITLKRA